jgi:hypothetical protein
MKTIRIWRILLDAYEMMLIHGLDGENIEVITLKEQCATVQYLVARDLCSPVCSLLSAPFIDFFLKN